MKRAVVALEGQQVVRLGVADGDGDLFLAGHGVEADHAALHVDVVQQFGNGGDLVGFRIDKQLTECQSAGRGPRADEVERIGLVRRGEAAVQRLAVDGHQFLAEPLAQRSGEFDEASAERLGIERGEDAPEGVVARGGR